MIVTTAPPGSRLVTQADHARLAADLLRLFRIPKLLEHPRRELLLRAVAEHDNGWWEADAAPRRDATGATALDFRDLAADLRREIWLRGVERYAAESPYLAALLATHCLRLLRPWAADPAWESFRAQLLERRQELLATAGESPAALALDDPWLALADRLSLAICTGEAAWVDLADWRLEVTDRKGGTAGNPGDDAIEVALQPFPFAGITVFELSCRFLAPGPFRSAAVFAGALAASPWRRIRVRLRPL
jgi:hypothetical protein